MTHAAGQPARLPTANQNITIILSLLDAATQTAQHTSSAIAKNLQIQAGIAHGAVLQPSTRLSTPPISCCNLIFTA
jgi:hypothetical protein